MTTTHLELDHKVREIKGARTLVHIPGKMSQPVERVERKGCGEDGLSSVFDGIRHPGDEFDDMRAVKCSWRDQVCDREAVKYCHRRELEPKRLRHPQMARTST